MLDYHPSSKLISRFHRKHKILVFTNKNNRVNIRSDTTEKIDNPKILISEDDMNFVYSLKFYVKLTNWHHMKDHLNIFSKNEKSGKINRFRH